MLLSKWENLPAYMQNEKVRIYYNILKNKKKSLVAKRVLDIVVSFVLIVLLLVPMCVIAVVVKCGSKGRYSDEMYATLLMPAGVTSLASITYRDEDDLFKNPEDIDRNYMEIVLPEKMVMNLEYIKQFHFFYDLKIG